jgi:hypothetical protein
LDYGSIRHGVGERNPQFDQRGAGAGQFDNYFSRGLQIGITGGNERDEAFLAVLFE